MLPTMSVSYLPPNSQQPATIPLSAFLRLLVSTSTLATSSTPVWMEGLDSWTTVGEIASNAQFAAIALAGRGDLFVTIYDDAGAPKGAAQTMSVKQVAELASTNNNFAVYDKSEWMAGAAVAGLGELSSLLFPASAAGANEQRKQEQEQMVFEEDVQVSFADAVVASGGDFDDDGGEEDKDQNEDNDAKDETALSGFLEETKGMGEEEKISNSKKRRLHHGSDRTPDEEGETKTKTETPGGMAPSSATPKPAAQKKQKKKDFRSANSKKWVYVTGFPDDVTFDEISAHFSRCGVLTLDPITQRAKIKIYRDENGNIKGDGSICFAKQESVQLCIDLLDGAELRPGDPKQPSKLTIKEAEFKQRGDRIVKGNNPEPTEKQRRTAKLAAKQKMDWDDGKNGRLTGGGVGLTIVTVKNAFADGASDEDFASVETALRERFPAVMKMTVFAGSAERVVMLKFKEVHSAEDCLESMAGGDLMGRKTTAIYWDGVTDYTSKGDEIAKQMEEEKRLDEFGDWLDGGDEELPEELRLRT